MEKTVNFDKVADDYRQIHNENIKITGTDSAYFSEFKVKKTLELLDGKKPSKILDFGCGDGLSEVFFLKYFPESKVIGVDTSGVSLERAKNRNLHNTEFVLSENITPRISDKVDLVFVACVLHHVKKSEINEVLRSLVKLTNIGGEIHVYEHNPFNPITGRLVNNCIFDRGVTLLRAGDLKRRLNTIGKFQVSVEYLLFFPRHKLFSKFLKFEKYLRFFPLGGQYMIRVRVI
ncbi:MAG TPA: class I SAM-dependent methyltransferase [Patescibacteria group bacterium]|nr:class I SAM-dependent methyltransferase [Patescibacteria group bacterium]